MSRLPHFLALIAASAVALLGAVPARAGGVRVLGDPTLPSFASLQQAIDAAAEGDVLVVGQGSYGGFVIHDKGLVVLAAPGAQVDVSGTAQVRALSPGKAVVLRGLALRGHPSQGVSRAGLRVADCAGDVRLEACSFEGGPGEPRADCSAAWGDGGAGALVSGSPRVAFARCTLAGGAGAGTGDPGDGGCTGGAGGAGLATTASFVALYDCDLAGGAGGGAGYAGGAGGAGALALDGVLFASGCAFAGGAGGDALSAVALGGGDGGAGLFVGSAAEAHLLDNGYAGGPGGAAPLAPGSQGSDGPGADGGGSFHSIPGPARSLEGGGVVADVDTLPLVVRGEPGDQVFLIGGSRPGWRVPLPVSGVWLVPYAFHVSLQPLGVVPGSGQLALQVGPWNQSGLPVGRPLVLQGLLVDAQGSPRPTGPAHAVRVDAAGPPDCDGDGVQDLVDVLWGASSDCDHDLVPDDCQGDCNGNGVPDPCDIASGASPDVNGNGIPDECEPTTTWYVDALAPPGGDGSASAPFRDLSEAIGASLSGDTVLVLPGYYAGTRNLELDFGGRDLVVRATGPLGSVVIDGEDRARAFHLRSGETRAARLEGLVIARGRAEDHGGAILLQGASPTISGCRFLQCSAGVAGGALFSSASQALVEDCTFLLNRTDVTPSSPSAGGAVAATSGMVVRRCDFLANRAGEGGAVYWTGSGEGVVGHSRFFGNHADAGGGAILGRMVGGASLFVDDCLIAGNTTDGDGGGLLALEPVVGPLVPNTLWLSQCTLVDNAAVGIGGNLALRCRSQAQVANSILRGGSASAGAQLAMAAVGPCQPPVLTVLYSNVEGGQAGVHVQGAGLLWGAGNQSADPLFADADGPDDDPLTLGDNDWRLGPLSPCADAGNNALLPPDRADVDGDLDTGEPVPLDLDLLPRQEDDPDVPDTGAGVPPLVDLGAYERP